MSQIWKYALPLMPAPVVRIPQGARPLCVQLQHGTPTVWLVVDPQVACDDWQFRIVRTGQAFDPADGQYIGTWQADGAVWHLFGPPVAPVRRHLFGPPVTTARGRL